MKIWNRFCFSFSEEKVVGVGVGAHVFRHQTWQTTPSEQMEWGFHRLTDWLRPASLQPATTGHGLNLCQKLQDHVIPPSTLAVANSKLPRWRTVQDSREPSVSSRIWWYIWPWSFAEIVALMKWAFLRWCLSRGCNFQRMTPPISVALGRVFALDWIGLPMCPPCFFSALRRWDVKWKLLYNPVIGLVRSAEEKSLGKAWSYCLRSKRLSRNYRSCCQSRF